MLCVAQISCVSARALVAAGYRATTYMHGVKVCWTGTGRVATAVKFVAPLMIGGVHDFMCSWGAAHSREKLVAVSHGRSREALG